MPLAGQRPALRDLYRAGSEACPVGADPRESYTPSSTRKERVMYAKLELIGNLTADPVVKDVVVRGENRKVTTFSVAVNDPFNKDKDPSYFNDLSAWNGTGENIAKFCAKGSRVFVVGNIEMRRFEHEGVKRTAPNITVQEVRFLGDPQRRDEIPTEVLAESAPPSTPSTEPASTPVEEPAAATQAEIPF